MVIDALREIESLTPVRTVSVPGPASTRVIHKLLVVERRVHISDDSLKVWKFSRLPLVAVVTLRVMPIIKTHTVHISIKPLIFASEGKILLRSLLGRGNGVRYSSTA